MDRSDRKVSEIGRAKRERAIVDFLPILTRHCVRQVPTYSSPACDRIVYHVSCNAVVTERMFFSYVLHKMKNDFEISV